MRKVRVPVVGADLARGPEFTDKPRVRNKPRSFVNIAAANSYVTPVTDLTIDLGADIDELLVEGGGVGAGTFAADAILPIVAATAAGKRELRRSLFP